MGRMWLGIGIFSIALSFYGYMDDRRKQARVAIPANGIAIYNKLDPRNTASISREVTAEDRQALDYAIDAWTKELGYFPLTRPVLLRGECFGIPVALACSLQDANAIILVNTMGYDERTIMLHEVGHLLGVPHIINDPLMNPSYNQRQLEPSPFAIAVARVAQQKEGKK